MSQFVNISEFNANKSKKKRQGRKQQQRNGLPNIAWLQFVPARVSEVITGPSHPFYRGEATIGAVIVEKQMIDASGATSSFGEAEKLSPVLYSPLSNSGLAKILGE